MAEGGGNEEFSRLLRELEADVTCGICYEQYREPKLLPCAHYFCRRCVKRVAQHAGGKPFPCPMCNELTTLPPQGVDVLPPAFFLQRLLEFHRAFDQKKEALRGPRKMTCDLCRNEGVTNFCKECDQFLCGGCCEKHQISSVYAQHQLMSLEELKSRGSRRNMSLLWRSNSTASYAGAQFNGHDSTGKQYAMCVKHDDPIKVYCHDHDMLICRDCTLYEHPRGQCRTGFITDEAPKARQALNAVLTPIRGAHEEILSVEREVGAVYDQVCAQELNRVNEVKRTFEEIRSRVARCEETLLEGITTASQGKKNALSGQRKALQISGKGIETTIDVVTQDVTKFTDDEIMTTFRQLEVKLQKEFAQHRHRALEPVTNADLVCTVPSPNAMIPIKVGLAYPREDLRHLRIAPPALMYVGSELNYNVHVPYSIGDTPEVEVQSEVDPSCVIRAVVTPWKDKEVVHHGIVVARYDVKFTPRVRGPHQLTTKVNGQELRGSPFDIFARIHPLDMGHVVRESKDAGKPYGIAVTPEGLLVTAGNGSKDLKIWSCDLKEVSDPIHFQLFHYPRGVAARPNGVIYSSDKGVERGRQYTIMKFVNGDFQRGAIFGSRNVRFIKIIRDQLYAADEKNSQVHRFSCENLDHIATFNTSKAADTHDIAEYNNQLYVVGSSQIAIYSFNDWKFVAHVPTKRATLSQMRGICFDRDGNMFITQAGQGVQGVYVFRPTGDFVASFGHFMEHPCGIVINDDGFVYVTDHKPKNRKIYAF